jgi:Catalytic LigB subunit of aromatic ring-opening dioxygenase
MATFLGIGMTHYPLLAGTDDHMAGLLRWTLQDPDIPAEEKDPANWPDSMRADWSDDGGTAAAGHHRKVLREELGRCREALDEFDPDVVVVWGDDQYENFREEVVPPFCVLAYPDLDVHPFAVMNDRGSPNAWGLPDDMTCVLHGNVDDSRALADALISDGFDMAYSYRKREGAHFPHAILNTQLFLDYDHAGREFPYPIVAVTVNCYGQHAIARRGGLARFADIQAEQLDPVGPTPRRCFDLGRAIARAYSATDKRVALVASSSWSHAFLCDRLWHIRPDTEADQRLYDALVRCDYDAWRNTTGAEIVEAGQHEMLNWFCLLGAMSELGMSLDWSEWVPTDVFNSNKCFAVYRQAANSSDRQLDGAR